MADEPQTKKFYRPSEVERMLKIPAQTFKYWESMFDGLNPARLKSGFRRYTTEDIATIRRIADLLYNKGLSIEAANRRMKETRIPWRGFKCRSREEALELLHGLAKMSEDNPKAQNMAEAVAKWLENASL